MLCSKRSHHSVKPAHHKEEQALLAATRESPEQSNIKKKKVYKEFPWWSRKIPHAAGQLSQMPQLLSPCSRAHVLQLLKPQALQPILHNTRSHCNEKFVNHNWRVVLAHPNKDPVQPKNSLQIINASEGVEKKEHSYTVGRM